MEFVLLSIISVCMTVFIGALFLTSKKEIRVLKRAGKILERQLDKRENFKRLLRRTQISVELFILIHLGVVILSLFQLINWIGGETEAVMIFAPAYLVLAPFYLVIIARSREYSKNALSDVEEIQRITHFLERTGAATKNINQYLAQTIKGPLGSPMKKIAAASMLSIDVIKEYQQLKYEFKDMREIVNYANISIQKQMTGKSDSLYQQQLEQIKQVKLTRYKMKRSQNRIKLTMLAFLVLISFLSVTLYPMGQAFMNDLIKNMSN